jgi:hypothetical protein
VDGFSRVTERNSAAQRTVRLSKAAHRQAAEQAAENAGQEGKKMFLYFHRFLFFTRSGVAAINYAGTDFEPSGLN